MSAADPADSVVTLTRDGDVIGTVERRVYDLDDGRQITTRQTLRFSANSRQTQILIEETSRTEDREQRTVSIRHRSAVDRAEAVTTATISGNAAFVQRASRAGTRATSIALPPGTRFDNGAGLLRNWNADETPMLEFFTLDVRAPLVERVVYTPAMDREGETGRALLRLAYAGEHLRSIARFYFDQAGALTGSSQPMFGNDIATSSSPVTTTGPGAPANHVQSSLMQSPYRITRDALDGHIRYTFGFGIDAGFVPPQTGEQRVTPVEDGFIVDICGACGPGLPVDDETLARALDSTFWLQADHPVLARVGRNVRERDESDADKMLRLARWADRRMDEVDFAGHFSAAEAALRRAGDCTEAAVLLAALGRAAGIPSYVASGIVYSREQYHGVSNVFTPHAWTLAFVDGEWRSFDFALDGFDASHVALTISDGDPGSIQAGHQLAALLRWDAMTEVRQRPAEAAR